MTLLAQTPAERRMHLVDANRVRIARATIKREIGAMSSVEGRAYLVSRIEEWDPLILSFRLREILCAVRSYGPQIARRHASRVGCSQDDRLVDLADEQLSALVELLRVPKRIMRGSSKASL